MSGPRLGTRLGTRFGPRLGAARPMAGPLVAVLALVASIALIVFPMLPASAAVIEVRVGSFYFEDSTVGDGVVTARVGDQLRFVFEDNGSHTAEVDELGISTGTLSKGAVFVTDPLTRPGTYTLYCRPHRRRGHVTTLVVLGDAATTTTTTTTTTTVSTTATTATTRSTTTPTTPTTDRSATTRRSTTSSGAATTTGSSTVDPATTGPTTPSGASASASAGTGPQPTDRAGVTVDAASTPDVGSDGASAASATVPGVDDVDGDAEAEISIIEEPTSSTAVAPRSEESAGRARPADDVEGDESPLPGGLVASGEREWLRSVWVAGAAAIPIAALAGASALAAGMRSRSTGMPDHLRRADRGEVFPLVGSSPDPDWPEPETPDGRLPDPDWPEPEVTALGGGGARPPDTGRLWLSTAIEHDDEPEAWPDPWADLDR